MVRVAPIKMQVGPKVLWFDPADIEVHADDKVIVSTERGTEFATATADIMEVSDELVEQLKALLSLFCAWQQRKTLPAQRSFPPKVKKPSVFSRNLLHKQTRICIQF